MIDAPRWDPDQYGRFQAQRDRAALDLMLQIPGDLAPTTIWDLGCGAGQHASLLRRRHPQALTHGLDSSDAMLEQARALDPHVDWRLGDIAGWSPSQPPDLILANASLQWLADPVTEMARLARLLAPGGVLAVQIPMAYETRHYAILREVSGTGPWAEVLAQARHVGPTPSPQACYDAVADAGATADVWTTTYLHALEGADAVLEWMKGTALRPHIEALSAPAADPTWRDAFLGALGERLSAAFPRRPDGMTLLPFPRLFLVARR